MKTLHGKLKYRTTRKNDETFCEIVGKLAANGKIAIFGTCHPASIEYLKKDFNQYSYLITLNKTSA